MDPVKFLEFKNTEDKCRSTASNTVPIACANCGSNDYNIQTLQQTNYLTPLYPAMPSFKLTSESFNDNFPINSHFFPRPFFQPVFHNSSILSNPFYAYNNIGMILQNRHLSEEHTQGKCESNNKSTQVSHCSDYLLNQIHQMPMSEDEINFSKFQPKHNAGGDTITKDLEGECHSKNSEESDTNYPSQCVCNNPSPWLYSPFILPIISYYILCHSQCSNPKLPSPNYSCNHSQMRQNKKEDDETKVSDTSSKEEKDETDFNESKEKLPKKSKNGVSEDFWTDDKIPKSEWKINNQKNGSSSSFFSISSLDYGEDIFFYTKRKSEAKTMSNNCGAEVGAGKSNAGASPNEHKGEKESAVKCETNQSDTNDAELDEKVKGYTSAPLSAEIEEEEEEEDEEEGENEDENENNENNVDEDEYDVKYVSPSNEESLITEQDSNLKIQNDFEKKIEMMYSEIQFKALDIPSEDMIASVLLKPSEEKLQGNASEDKKPMSDYSESMVKDRVTYKKTIKNFTMADETNSKFYEESKTLASMAAGGDLGGEHCVGYRVEISPPSRQRGNVQNLSKNENEMETNEILSKDLGKELTDRSKENNESSTNMEKSPDGGEFENKSKAKVKLGRNFKSGIAKLSINFKAKCIDSNTENSEVRNCVPETPKIRRKHNCMATVRTTENNEVNSKIQKSKYSRERQGKHIDSARDNGPPNKIQKQSTKSTDSRQKRKDQQLRAPCKSTI